VKNIVIKYAFLQGMVIPYSIQNGFIYLRVCDRAAFAAPPKSRQKLHFAPYTFRE
jgi:hypothetical protein